MGRVRNSRDAAYADLLATEHGRHAVVLALVAGVARPTSSCAPWILQLEIARSNDARRARGPRSSSRTARRRAWPRTSRWTRRARTWR